MKKISMNLIACLFLSLICLQYAAAASASEWTFMVYMDADNDLEQAGIGDFLQMAEVGSNSDINIIVQFDRIPGYTKTFGNWTNCQRFFITKGMKPTKDNAIADWGDGNGGREVDMSNPQNLIDFVNWGKSHYPALHYAVVLWNHGDGWKETNESVMKRKIIKSVCSDDTSGSDASMEIKEVQQAFTALGPVDVIGFDACLMGMAEVAYELRNMGAVMIGSEATEPDSGWPYDAILADLTAFPDMTAAEFGADIVNRYGESDDYGITMSAVDLSMMDNLRDSINAFSSALMNFNKSDILNIRNYSQTFHDNENIDLYDFTELIYNETDDSDVQTAAYNVMNAINTAVIASTCDDALPDAHGLAIYFPRRNALFDTDYNAATIDFVQDADWDEFLHWYYTAESGVINLIAPVNGSVLSSIFPARFSWEAENLTSYKIQFSSTSQFIKKFGVTLTIPNNNVWLYGNTTDEIPEQIWNDKWKRIKQIEQKNGIVYWRIIGRTQFTKKIKISDTRFFLLDFFYFNKTIIQ